MVNENKRFLFKKLLKPEKRVTVKFSVQGPLERLPEEKKRFFTGEIEDERKLFLR